MKSFILLFLFVSILSCSKEDPCNCKVVEVEKTNYLVSECIVDLEKLEDIGTAKQARLAEQRSNCQ